MGKKIIFLLLLVVLFPLVAAQEVEVLTFGENITFVETITLNGFPSPTIIANITITDPDNNLLANFAPMVFDATSQTFNYELDSNNFTSVGIYTKCISATASGENQTTCFDFELTRTGTVLRTSSGLVYVAVFFAALFVFIFSVWAFLRIEWKDHVNEEHKLVGISGYKYLKVLMFFVSYMVLLFIFSIGNDMATSFLFLQGAGQFFKISYLVLLVSIGPAVIVTFAFLIINILSDQKIQQEIIRGIPLSSR